MKQITFELDSFYGYGCSGCSYSSNETNQMKVDDAVAATLQTLLDAAGPDEDGRRVVAEDAVKEAVEAGHTELQPLHEQLHKLALDMDARYWLFKADNDCISESLEPYFYEDVKNGLYKPVPDDCYDHDRGYEPDSFEACRYNYLEWVNSHNDDYWFIAERVGLDLGLVYEESEATYRITEIKK